MFKIKFIYKSSHTLFSNFFRTTVTYASETWVLKENMINKLMIFERKIMRKNIWKMFPGGSKVIKKSMIY